MQHNGAGGYSRVGEQLRQAIERQGAEVLPYTDWKWDACVQVSPPRASTIGSQLRPDLVLHTMIECDQTPPGWADLLNRVGMVWVPSSYAERIFREGGVTIPIMKTHYGIAPEWSFTRRPTSGPFRVLAWGDTLASRKNSDAIIKAFQAAAIPDSVLELKLQHPLMPDCSHWNGQENIIIWNGSWSDHELRDWLATGNVGVYVSSGEGYGLQPKEMMASGLPMVAAINTGLAEYMRPDLIREVAQIQRPSTYWKRIFSIIVDEPYPVVDSIVEGLWWMHDHPDEAQEMAIRASAHARSYTWDAAARSAIEQLSQHYLGAT